jgi:hypothetical protein
MQRMALILAIWIAGLSGAWAQTTVTVVGPVAVESSVELLHTAP